MRAFPALPFAPNEALHVLTYDFCEALSKAANDVLSHIDHEADNVSDTVRRALEWGADGEARKEWKGKLR